MKKGIFLHSLIGLLALSCTVQEIEPQTPPYEPAPEDDVFYASLAPESDTKVYVDEHVKTLWDEKDQISIFNNGTLNQKYEFMGKTGDNAGYFKRVTEESGTRAGSGYVYAVYPYQESTTLDDSGLLTLMLPEEQTYREGSFGPGANTMVSATDGTNNLLRFKNVGGFLVLKFYGGTSEKPESIKSIKLEGRNGELLSGEATMTPVIGELPQIAMAPTAGSSITLTPDKAVDLGTDAENATMFWMVVPPTDFTEGFTLTVTGKKNKVFIKETDKHLTVERNGVLRIAPIKVTMADPLDPNKVIYYTTSDKQIITPAEGADFGAEIKSNDYVDVKGIMVFKGNVTQIGDDAFAGCETLTGMTIPETVTTIGDYAFAGCTNLGAKLSPEPEDPTEPSKAPTRSDQITFVIPDGVTSIGAYAFKDCESLKAIIIPDSVTSIGDGAFEGCTNLTDINIPDSVTDMGDNVFNGCTSITSVTIPNGVESIEDYAFAGCDNLIEVIIPETVTSIGRYAFENCEHLVSITIPDGVTSIKDFTFAGCCSLPSINIPDGVKSIGSSAFESCFKLANVTLPSSVEFIDTWAFASCHAFTSFTIPSRVTSISDGLFSSCSQLSSVNIHDGVESIGYGAFLQCSSLTDISIPESVTSIGENAFSESGLTSITIPENVESLGNWAFRECTSMTFFTILASIPPVIPHGEGISEGLFKDTNDFPIYVPAESLAAYKTAEGWSNYASRIHSIDSPNHEIQGHAYVDLGTGLKWATMNVGAATESDPGERYNWTAGMAAVEEWGGSWRLPTKEELDILIDENKFIWTWDSTNYGCWVESLIAGFEGNRIFLPANGLYDPTDPEWNIVRTGFYWSSTLESDPFYLGFDLDDEASPLLVGAFDYNIQISLRPVAD